MMLLTDTHIHSDTLRSSALRRDQAHYVAIKRIRKALRHLYHLNVRQYKMRPHGREETAVGNSPLNHQRRRHFLHRSIILLLMRTIDLRGYRYSGEARSHFRRYILVQQPDAQQPR
jgi:hypothetical protein